MRRVLHFTICVSLLLGAALVPVFAGDVIDGVVAVVNRQPILQSDWEEAVSFEAFMQQKPLAQMTDASRVAALQRLIDRRLLKAQMGDDAYMQPSPQKLQEEVARLRAQVPNGKEDGAWRKLLASYGLNEDRLKEHLRNQVQVMNFVEVRLRPNVHVQDEEIEHYYKNQLLPDLQKNGGKPLPLAEASPRIRELLTQQHMDELLDAWLHNLRQQAEIRSFVPLPAGNASGESPGAPGAN